jgi:hypothetical protein
MNEVLSLFVTTMRNAYRDSRLETDEKRKEYVVNVVRTQFPVFSQRICLRTFLPSLFDLVVLIEKGEVVIGNVFNVRLLSDDDTEGVEDEGVYLDDDDDDEDYFECRG